MALVRWQSAFDFLVLAFVLYAVLRWAGQTRALRVILWIVGVHAASRLASWFDLIVTSWVLNAFSLLLLVILLFGFQPELRDALLRLDRMVRLGLQSTIQVFGTGNREIAAAAFRMASERLGALIVIARNDSPRELISGGVAVGAEITPELLLAIFRKESPLHDGAVIVEGNRIARAGAVLPLTQREIVPPEYGTRHRAAMGLAERTDALVVVVSEERGAVTLMNGKAMTPMTDVDTLAGILSEQRMRAPQAQPHKFSQALFGNLRYKFAALGIAGLVLGMSVLSTETTVRTLSVPVEFANVPPGMAISSQSTNHIEVQLRGGRWLMDSLDASALVARVDLRRADQGLQEVRIRPDSMNLPPGVIVDRVAPTAVSVRLIRRIR
ncbi:MAG: diadenylate cyclase [Bryobacteraceae bacterium]